MVRKISQIDREAELSALASTDGYEFIGWVGEYKNAHSRAIMKCSMHGEWSVRVYSFIGNACRCRGCVDVNKTMTREECESKIVELALRDGFEFQGWVDGHVNGLSRVIVRCHTHGDWSVTVNSFINGGTRCHSCGAIKKRVPREKRELEIAELAARDGFTFVGWDGDYRGVRGKVIINCPVHGDWSTAVSNFISDGSRCATCAQKGYSPRVHGTLYALLSECGSMVKIGISNNPSRRQRDLSRATPFNFTIHRELPNIDGSIPRILEKLFHDQFPSAGLTGFDGATEWRQMSPDVTTWLDLLQ